MTDAVIEFAKWVIREGAFQAADLDGLSIQEKALELGLLTKASYDPEKHGENEYAEPGDDWYVFSNLLTQTDPSPAPEAQLAARTGGVKPLDLSNLLRHAFFEGFMIAGGSQEAAAERWPEYDPETCAAYSRILSALEPAAPEGQQPVTESLELSGNTGELIDRMAAAIRDWGSHYDDGPWATLSEDRKVGWRGELSARWQLSRNT